MLLMTKELAKRLPRLGEQDGKDPRQVRIVVHYFSVTSGWDWWAYEGEPEGDDDWMMFGLVRGYEAELGPWSLKELESVRGPLGLGVERDLHWRQSTTLDDVLRLCDLGSLADALIAGAESRRQALAEQATTISASISKRTGRPRKGAAQ